VYSNSSYPFLHPSILSSSILHHSHFGPSSQESISVFNRKPLLLLLIFLITLPIPHFPSNNNHTLSLALNFPFYCSCTHNPSSLPILLVVKMNPRSMCPYLTVHLFNFLCCYISVLTYPNIY
jgi:hypothetical protein